MLTPLINEIEKSYAQIIQWDENNIPTYCNSEIEVIFNGSISPKEYEQKLIQIIDILKRNIEESIEEKQRTEQITILTRLIQTVEDNLRVFRTEYTGSLTNVFLRKEYSRNGINPETYFGDRGHELISSFISKQLKVLKLLHSFIQIQIEIVNKKPKQPSIVLDSRNQILIIDLLRKGKVFDYYKIHPDHACRARLLSLIIGRSTENTSKHLESISSTKNWTKYYNVENLTKVRPYFERVEMYDIIKIIDEEIEKLKPS